MKVSENLKSVVIEIIKAVYANTDDLYKTNPQLFLIQSPTYVTKRYNVELVEAPTEELADKLGYKIFAVHTMNIFPKFINFPDNFPELDEILLERGIIYDTQSGWLRWSATK